MWCFNSLSPGRCNSNYKNVIVKLILQIDIMSIYLAIVLIWMPQNPLMVSQHCLRQWLGSTRRKTIIWASVDPNLCHHMVSLGHSEWTLWPLVVPWDLVNHGSGNGFVAWWPHAIPKPMLTCHVVIKSCGVFSVGNYDEILNISINKDN